MLSAYGVMMLHRSGLSFSLLFLFFLLTIAMIMMTRRRRRRRRRSKTAATPMTIHIHHLSAEEVGLRPPVVGAAQTMAFDAFHGQCKEMRHTYVGKVWEELM